MKKKITHALEKGKNFLIASHYHPDGDALGSSLALGIALKKLKKDVVVYNRDPVPFNLKFLPASQSITSKLPPNSFEYAVMVDCAQPKRVSDAFAKALEAGQFQKLVVLDHHLLDHRIGDLDYVDPKQASTGCVVWDLLKMMKLNEKPDIANLVYCTLTVDTGSFRYSNTTQETFEMAAELVKYGADPWLVARNLEESNPPERYRLLGLALKTLEVKQQGKLATMEVSHVMLQGVKGREDLTDEFANYPRSIAGVEVSALFREMEDGKIKISLRSKTTVDVSTVAKQFGGGGHRHAAGCIVNGDLARAKKEMEAAIEKSLA